jgi:type II secretory pathway pseudopilin PulG
MTRLSDRGADDSGMSLIEMLIAVMLTGTIGAVVTSSITTGLHDQVRITAHAVAIGEVRTATQRVTRELRDAAPLLAASATAVTVQQTTTAGSRVLTYSVITTAGVTNLVVDEKDYNSSTPSIDHLVATQPQKTVISDLNDTADYPVFTFAPASTYQPAQGSGVNPNTCAIPSAPTTYSPACVGEITVHVRQNVGTTSEVIDVTENVEIRNLG